MRYCESSCQWLMGRVYDVKVCRSGHLSPEINKVLRRVRTELPPAFGSFCIRLYSLHFYWKSGASHGIIQDEFHNSGGIFLRLSASGLQQLTSAQGECTWTHKHTHAQMRTLPSMTQIKDGESMAALCMRVCVCVCVACARASVHPPGKKKKKALIC